VIHTDVKLGDDKVIAKATHRAALDSHAARKGF
jgi:hypothetical protein